jgi:hypothetical protein
MLLIPIHLLIDDSKTKFPSFFNEKTLGISRKTIENYLNQKSKPTKKSLNTIKSSLFNTNLLDYKSIEKIISLLNNLNIDSKWQSKGFQNLTNESVCNSQRIFFEMVNLNYAFTMDILSHGGIKIERDTFISILDKYVNIEPINEIYKSFNHSDYELHESLNLLRFDIILYMLSSLDVDLYEVSLRKESNFKYIIPRVEDDVLASPYRLLIDKIMKRHNILSINELSHIICDNEDEFPAKKRFINRLRSTIRIYDPENKSVLDVFIKILNNKSIEFKNVEFEINIYIFTSKILNRLLIWMKKTEIFKSDQEIADFFTRYEMWYNHHYAEQQNQQ